MGKINIKIIMPDKKKLDETVDLAVLPGIDGDFEVQEGHSAFITKLRSGSIRLQTDGNSEYYAIHEGFVTVENNNILILSECCETKKEIDIKRAELARIRAEKRMQTTREDSIDHRRAELALKRAIARLETSRLST
jgi:F-type H+-transporting ATPase subunit epsilon